MSSPGTFAFLVHPRARLREDMRRVWRPLGRLPEPLYDVTLRKMPLPPVRMASAHLGGSETPLGHVLLVPFGARHLLAQPGEGRRRIGQAIDRAAGLGADIVGLGALTAPVSAGGAAFRARTDVGITNGNAYTAAVVDSQLRTLLDDATRPRPGRHVAVVGATGSVGTAVVRLLARDAAADRLTLVARSAPRLERLLAEVGPRIPAAATRDLATVAEADVVVLLTAAADAVLGPEHLAEGAVVLDATQPRNTSPGLSAERPDVLVLDGGVVDVPTLRLRGGDIGLPPGQAYACFAETALLALAGHRGHFSLGLPTLEQVDQLRAVAADFAPLGFHPAAPTSFGRPVEPSSRSFVGSPA